MPDSSTSTRLRDALRVLLGLTLFLLLFRVVDVSETFALLVTVSWTWIVLLLAISAVLIGISCAKWDLFLRNREIHAPFDQLCSLYLIGYFFNNFTPGNVGGDVVRGALLGHQSGKHSDAFGSVFMERFTGFLALFVMALVGSTFKTELLEDLRLRWFMGGVALLFFGAVVAMAFPPAQRLIRWVFSKGEGLKVVRKLSAFAEVVFSFHEHKSLLAKAMGWSLAFQLMTIVNTQAACMSLGLEVSFLDLMVLVPMVLLVAAVPLSPGGLGLLEGGFVFFLAMAGLTEPEAFSVALILRGKNLFLALIGGLLLLLRRSEPDTPPPAEDASV